jgi:acetyl-CoA synthetase (ADP-forming)
MDTFFNPSSVVVIGASNSPFNLGATICRSLNEFSPFKAPVHAVNRKGEDVYGCPGYTALADIPGHVDLAVIIAPAQVVPGFIRQCGEKGIKHIVIESSGFSEGGDKGRKLQREIDRSGRLMACASWAQLPWNTQHREQVLLFLSVQKDNFDTFIQESGEISYIIQSGGIVVIVLESFMSDVVKASKIVSIGNKSDIDEADMIEYFNTDEKTKVICMYLENIKDGRKLIEVARKVAKPILVFKVGRTSEGVRADQSHTAGMANNDLFFETPANRPASNRVNSISELHTMPKIFTHMPPLKGKRIAMFTNSGPSAVSLPTCS